MHRLIIRQRLVLRLELQVEGQALLALRDVLARVDVEQRDALEVLAAILRDDALDISRGDALIDDDGEVTRDGGYFGSDSKWKLLPVYFMSTSRSISKR